MTNKQASTRFMKIFIPTMILYSVSCFAVPEILKMSDFAKPIVYAISLIPALCIGVALWAQWRQAMEVDEYMRHLQLRAMVFSLGCILAVSAAIGFLQFYAGLENFSVFFAIPAFYVFHAMGMFVLTRRDNTEEKNP
jgi:hypothetical protein